jgi:hypothetical protein
MDTEKAKLWLDLFKVLLGTTLVGLVGVFLNHEINKAKTSQDEFRIRGEYYEKHLVRAMEGSPTNRIFLADFLSRFAPTEFDRTQWREYHTYLSNLPKKILRQSAEIEIEVQKLAAITEKPEMNLTDSEKVNAKELEKKIAEQQIIQRTNKAKLKGLSETTLSTLSESYDSGQLEQPRGIRNNNPVLVAKDKWIGLMPKDEMTPAQLAEKKYAVFKHPVYGFRAGARIVLRQQREKGRSLSVSEQLDIWFGSSEARDTAAKRIASTLDKKSDDPIDFSEPSNLSAFLIELAKFHNGLDELPYPSNFVSEGIALAMER